MPAVGTPRFSTAFFEIVRIVSKKPTQLMRNICVPSKVCPDIPWTPGVLTMPNNILLPRVQTWPRLNKAKRELPPSQCLAARLIKVRELEVSTVDTPSNPWMAQLHISKTTHHPTMAPGLLATKTYSRLGEYACTSAVRLDRTHMNQFVRSFLSRKVSWPKRFVSESQVKGLHIYANQSHRVEERRWFENLTLEYPCHTITHHQPKPWQQPT